MLLIYKGRHAFDIRMIYKGRHATDIRMNPSYIKADVLLISIAVILGHFGSFCFFLRKNLKITSGHSRPKNSLTLSKRPSFISLITLHIYRQTCLPLYMKSYIKADMSAFIYEVLSSYEHF